MRIFTTIVTFTSAVMMFLFLYATRPWSEGFLRASGTFGVTMWLILCLLAVGLAIVGAHNSALLFRHRRPRPA